MEPASAARRGVIAVIAIVSVAAVAIGVAAALNYSSGGIVPSGQGVPSSSTHGSWTGTIPQQTNSTTNPANTISVSGLGLCSSNCGYPAPYASAMVTINANVPLSSLAVYVNNTYDGLPIQNPHTTTVACSTAAGRTCSVLLGGATFSNATYTTTTKYYATCNVPENGSSCSATYTGSVNNMTRYAYEYKGSIPSRFIPAVAGARYVFSFVATFQDGSTATATVTTVAS